MDIGNTTEPRSDQQNYDDYLTGDKTVTISEVRKGSAEQPVELHLAEHPGRPYKPGKSMRRVLIACWGSEASAYVGRKLTLYGDPNVMFGGQAVGGIRIRAMSHITEPKSIALTVTRGKRTPFVVQPLGDAAKHEAALTVADSLPSLEEAWNAARAAGVANRPEVVAAKDARKAELSGGASK